MKQADVQRPRRSGPGFILGAIAMALIWGLVLVGALRQIGEPFAGFRYGVVLRVSPWNQPDWNGIRQGLTTHDQVLTANGEVLDSPAALRDLIRSQPVGTPIRYTYRRDRAEHAVTVETQVFTPSDFMRSFLPPLAIGGVFMLIGLGTYFLKPQDPAARALLMLTGSIGAFLALGIDNDTHRWFNTPLFSGFSLACMLLGSACIHLGLTFPQPRDIPERARHLPLAAYLVALGLVLNQRWTDAFVPRHVTFALWTVLGLTWLMFSLVRSWRSARSPLVRAQAMAVLTGSVVAFFPSCLTYAIPVLLGFESQLSGLLLRVATLSTLLFPLSVAYSIVRHRLFDIELATKRTMAYGLVTWLLTALYFGIMTGMAALIGKQSLSGNVLATAAVALLFAPVRDRTKRAVDRLFFRTPYDFQAVVTEFGEQARELLTPQHLLDLFLSRVAAALQPEYLAVLLRPEGTDELVLSRSLGVAEGTALTIPADHDLVVQAACAKQGVFGDETAFSALRAPYVWPLLSKEGLIGCVLLGPRKSGQGYQVQDSRLLATLIQQLAVCFKNAQLFDQLTRYAGKLEDLVRLYEEAHVEAMTDPLTCLFNRRAFQRHLLPNMAESRRYGRPLSLIVFDIDHFKRFNDTYGHATGDAVIEMVARVLKATIRLSDIPARWGGEEFVVALPETGLADALIAADRIRTSVAQERLSPLADQEIPPVTISLGVAQCRAEDSLESLVERADRALYVAKSKGRNQAHSLDFPARGAEAPSAQ